jgi:hypothetical protein
MLGLGVAATVGANVLFGLPWGALGAVISSWPAIAFIGTVEVALYMARSARAPASGHPVPEPPTGLNGHGHAAAERFADELARGEVPGIRRIRRELKVGQPRAQEVRECLAALATGNGHGEVSAADA